jgi:hypothetical protein
MARPPGAWLRLLTGVTAALALALVPAASASYLVTRNPADVSLKVDSQGRAVVFYYRNGRLEKPLFWGAINARPPSSEVRQVEFAKDYSGGWGAFRKPLWKTIKNECLPYDGPPLPYLVVACKAPDGSYWALQRWQKMLPNLGIAPWKPEQDAWELHLSHWSGDLPKLDVYTDWVYSRKFHHLFGRFTYLDQPIYGFGATRQGSPLDTYGRNVYLDTYNSAYGPGWRRENSFLAHRPNGNFCYGFYRHNPYPGYPNVGRRPAGHGERYRITAMGPGVTPIIMWEGLGLPNYNRRDRSHVEHEHRMNRLGDRLAAGDQSRTPCDQH